VIESIEGIELVSVVSIPDPVAIDLPAAVFVRRPGFEHLTADRIVKIVSERLPARKHLLGGAYMVDEIPLLGNGKIQTRVVKEIALDGFRRNSLKVRY
jgi:acyl-CoA synthetase (AMP-forming)/AMP-acid ligase II